MYKMVDINAETWGKAGASVIWVYENDNVNKTLFKLRCISDVKKWWGGKNLYDLIDKEIKGKYEAKNMNDLAKQQIRKYKIDRVRFIKESKHSMNDHEDILIPIIMKSRQWIKTICQKYFTKLQKWRNIQSKIKPIKIKKQPGTTYCFGCNDYTQSFKPQEVKMTNKVSRFLKQKIN